MKSRIGLSIVAVLLLSALGVASAEPLRCSATVWQQQQLQPRTQFGQQLVSFTVDLAAALNPEAAAEYQNVCVRRRDFVGGTFSGTLCVVMFATREVIGGGQGGAEASPAVYVSVHRDPNGAVGSARLSRPGDMIGGGVQSIGQSVQSFEGVIPVNPAGRSFSYRQTFAAVGRAQSRDLARIEIECAPSE